MVRYDFSFGKYTHISTRAFRPFHKSIPQFLVPFQPYSATRRSDNKRKFIGVQNKKSHVRKWTSAYREGVGDLNCPNWVAAIPRSTGSYVEPRQRVSRGFFSRSPPPFHVSNADLRPRRRQ